MIDLTPKVGTHQYRTSEGIGLLMLWMVVVWIATLAVDRSERRDVVAIVVTSEANDNVIF